MEPFAPDDDRSVADDERSAATGARLDEADERPRVDADVLVPADRDRDDEGFDVVRDAGRDAAAAAVLGLAARLVRGLAALLLGFAVLLRLGLAALPLGFAVLVRLGLAALLLGFAVLLRLGLAALVVFPFAERFVAERSDLGDDADRLRVSGDVAISLHLFVRSFRCYPGSGSDNSCICWCFARGERRGACSPT